MLRDTADKPVYAAYAAYLKNLPVAEQRATPQEQLQVATQNEVSKGITTIDDMSGSFQKLALFRQATEQGKLQMRKLQMRIYVNIDDTSIANFSLVPPLCVRLDVAKFVDTEVAY